MAAYMASRPTPSRNMGVCFVCGSVGASCGIHIKPREKGAYFPFLEHHDPPKGAQLPTSDGKVNACHLCYAFLNQQWESFERTKTPAIKRLYWLKRMDNGPFTGAEMRIQGEYAAQIMGLQYTPGSFTQGYQDYDSNQSNNLISPASTASNYTLPNNVSPERLPKHSNSDSNDVLDLSVTPTKQSKAKENHAAPANHSSRHAHEKTTICFLCLKEHPIGLARFISSRKCADEEPYFPFLKKMPCPKGAMALTSQGLTRVCSSCSTTLRRQWKAFDSTATPEDQKVYRINDEPIGLFQREESNAGRRVSELSSSEYMDFQEVCYLCGQVYHKDSMKLLYTKPPDETSKHSMYFPFVASLQKPSKARPMDGEGRVLSCRACYSYLQRQWQSYQTEGVALNYRKFVLRPLTASGKSNDSISPASSSSGTPTASISQPLNIQISASSSTVQIGGTTAPGLLAIAPGLTPQMVPGPILPGSPFYPGYPLNIPMPNKPVLSQTLERNTPKDLKPIPSSEAKINSHKDTITSKKKENHSPGVYCFVCGHGCNGYKSFSLRSYPRKQESLMQKHMEPFFPFLGSRDPAPGSQKMTDEGTVQACKYCYYSLIRQWKQLEGSALPGENNRWLRKYNVKSHACYVCEGEQTRNKVRTIFFTNFPFLRELSKPKNASLIEFNDSVIVCEKCERDLVVQFKEFQRQGVPLHIRQYKLPSALLQQVLSSSQTNQNGVQPLENYEDGQASGEERSHQEKGDFPSDSNRKNHTAPGLPQGTKPPPLTMVSPAAKTVRTTATVQPLSQVMPSSSVTSHGVNAAMNATRASSFAAALQKLAKQAGDIDQPISSRESVREPSPASSSTSPRAPTPKRVVAPPLVYTTNQSSPPVVTIAPTQAHNHHITSDGRKSADRVSVVQSTGSSMIEPLGIKQERDKMAPPIGSHDRRDEERPHSKESSAKLPAHSVITSTASSSRDEPVRGFQPYRPGDEARAHLGPHFHSLDPAYSAYHSAAAAAAAFSIPPHPFPHPAFRFDDPLLMERYRMMQQPFMPYPHPSMLQHGMPPLLPPGARYPPDLLSQPFPSLISPGAKLPEHRSPGASSERPKTADEQRREQEELERVQRERDRERELERERERERERQREREREERERAERERAERAERERLEQERIERERARERERERERQRSIERLRQEQNDMMIRDGRRSPHRQDDQGRYGSITQGTPRDHPMYGSVAEKYHNAMLAARGDPAAIHKLEEEAKWRERNQQLHLQEKERDRQLMHQQFLREQDMLLRERERRIELEKREREKSGPPPLTPSKHHAQEDSHSRHIRTSEPANFHRPFEQTLANGFERNHFTDYERRKMTERILAQDRQVLQDARPRTHSNSEQNNTDSRDARNFDHHNTNDRAYIDKNHHRDGLQPPRVVENDKSQNNSVNNRFSQYQYDRPHPDFPTNYQMSSTAVKVEPDSGKEVQTLYRPSESSHTAFQRYSKPVVTIQSKLDLEEKKIREARINGTYDSEEEEVEEDEEDYEEDRKRQKLLLIASGPPLKPEKSRKKMKFLNMFGLTSKEHREDLDFERLCKRRRMNGEPSLSPVHLEEGERTSSPLTYPSPIHPDSLNRAHDYKYKVRFLYELRLQAITPERRKQMESVRQACEADKQRRNGLVTTEPSFTKAPRHYKVHNNLLASPPGMKSKPQDDEESQHPISHPEPKRISLGQLHERHLASSRNTTPQHPSHTSQSQSHATNSRSQSSPGQQQLSNSSSKPTIFTDKRERPRNISRDFAHEFHESVLQTTRQQELHKSGNRSGRPDTEIRYKIDNRNEKSVDQIPVRDVHVPVVHKAEVPPGVSHEKLSSTEGATSGSAPSGSASSTAMKWPGIEAVIECYQKHVDEQKMEKGVLFDTCQRLKHENQELNKTAERLSLRMSDLIQNKQQMDDERRHLQGTVDNLKKCLKFIR